MVLEKILESPLDCKENKPINPKGNQSEYSLEGLMLKLKLQSFGHLLWRADSLDKTLMLGKTECRSRRGQQRMRLIWWHHQLNGHECEQAPGDGEVQGSLACCSPWGHKESDMTERLNNNNNNNNNKWIALLLEGLAAGSVDSYPTGLYVPTQYTMLCIGP